MFCQNCGKEISNQAVICVGCGCAVEHRQATDAQTAEIYCKKPAILNLALIFSVLLSVPGLVLSIIGLSLYSETPYRRVFSKTLLTSCAFLLVYFILFLISGNY